MNELINPEGHYQDGVSVYYSEVEGIPSKSGLVVPQLIFGDKSKFIYTPGNHLLQYRRDETRQEYEGPDVFVRTFFGKRKVPTYLLGSHNNALFCWCEGLIEEYINEGFVIVHFDQRSHGDYTEMVYPDFNPKNLEQVYDLAISAEPGCFIYPVLKTGLARVMVHVSPNIGEQIIDENLRVIKCGYKADYLLELLNCIQTGNEHHELGLVTSRILVVDIDIDYFELGGREDMGRRFVKGSIAIIRRFMKLAGVNTIATSPGFIDQSSAIELAKKIVK